MPLIFTNLVWGSPGGTAPWKGLVPCPGGRSTNTGETMLPWTLATTSMALLLSFRKDLRTGEPLSTGTPCGGMSIILTSFTLCGDGGCALPPSVAIGFSAYLRDFCLYRECCCGGGGGCCCWRAPSITSPGPCDDDTLIRPSGSPYGSYRATLLPVPPRSSSGLTSRRSRMALGQGVTERLLGCGALERRSRGRVALLARGREARGPYGMREGEDGMERAVGGDMEPCRAWRLLMGLPGACRRLCWPSLLTYSFSRWT